MKIKVSRFGEILTARPEGREAGLVLLSSDLRGFKVEAEVEIDFTGVQVMTPSWLSEFTKTLSDSGIKNIRYCESSNVSVSESIRFVYLEQGA